jgi:hypothetical protein
MAGDWAIRAALQLGKGELCRHPDEFLPLRVGMRRQEESQQRLLPDYRNLPKSPSLYIPPKLHIIFMQWPYSEKSDVHVQ